MKAASGLLPAGGAIVNVASTAALLGIGVRGAYTAAKAGLVGLTRVVALELAPRQVRVNSIAPGSVRTALVEAAIAGGHISESQLRSRIPLGRLGTVDEIAAAVAFLAGEAASYITGQVLVVDGGWTIQGVPDAAP
jgi:3-oxoacyl-[acyl-carrier protein] reductase